MITSPSVNTWFMPMLKRLLRALGLLLALGNAAPLAAQTTDKAALLRGVGKVPLPASPDFLATTIGISEQPEIILLGRAAPDQPYELAALASSRLGKGKLLVFGTAGYFRKPLVQQPEVQKLLANALAWGSSAGRTHRPRVQVWGGDDALTAFLTQKARAELVGTPTALSPRADILLLSREIVDTAQLRRVAQFVRRGGTLLYGSPLPGQQRATPQVAVAMSFNEVLTQAGLLQIVYPSMMYAHQGFLRAGAVPNYLGMSNILRDFGTGRAPTGDQFNESGVFAFALDAALAGSTPGSPMDRRFRQLAMYQADSLLVPTPAAPIRRGSDGRYAAYLMQLRLRAKRLLAHPNPAYVAPAAATFPGAVPAGGRVTAALTLPVRVGANDLLEPAPVYRRPHGTGLYVPPGERVTISLTGPDSLRHLEAQIGVHSDDLMQLSSFSREAADLTRYFELKHGRTEIYSPYGGLLLLNIPDTSSLKELRVTVKGAVRAPRFELGKTSLADWTQTIRQYPAPWAELVSDNVSLTVPAARIRALADPAAVLAFWDTVLAADAKLAALTVTRRHAERIVVDQEVAYGYMFTAVDRIVVPNDKSCGEMLDVDFMQKNGSWGHFHELGHRHQFWGIDFEGTGEVSVNLYTMYVFDKVLHKGLFNHPQIASRQEVADKATWYMEDKPSFEKWKSDPFLALCMYVQLIHAFGWEPIEQVYRQYRLLPKSQYPATEAAKRDYWFAAISTATRRNLAPFFAQWKVPVGEEAAKAVAAYPAWLPPEMQQK
jgi:hypothetical protein